MKRIIFVFLFLNIFVFSFGGELTKIAILKIEDRSGEYINSEVYTETLQIEVVNSKAFRVVERSMLGKIVEEQKLKLSGLTEDEQAAQIGKLAGADKIWVGSISKTESLYIITVKSIDTTTGIIDFADQVYSYTKDELLELMRVIVDRMIKKSKGENVPKHEPKKKAQLREQNVNPERGQARYNENYSYNTSYSRPDSSFDIGGYLLSFQDGSGYCGFFAMKPTADRNFESFLDFRIYGAEIKGWELSGINFNVGININLIANGYIIFGGGIGFGWDSFSFKKESYSIDGYQWICPLSLQFGFHLGKYFIITFDYGYLLSLGAEILDNNYYDYIKHTNIPSELKNYLTDGVSYTFYGIRFMFLF